MNSSSVPVMVSATLLSVDQISWRMAFHHGRGIGAGAHERPRAEEPVMVYGIHISGSIGSCKPRFLTSATTPMISNPTDPEPFGEGLGKRRDVNALAERIFLGEVFVNEGLIHNREFALPSTSASVKDTAINELYFEDGK